MEHTFLFREGKWKSEGEFLDERGKPSKVVGGVHVFHTYTHWINEGYVKNTDPPFNEIHNRYEIVPFEDGRDETSWFSINPDLGHLMGHLVVVGDSILSNFSTEDNACKGFEYLLQTDHNTYINRGVLYREGEKLSSWIITLRREV